MSGPIPLSALDVALASSLLLLHGLLSAWLGLGLTRRVGVAALRSVLQLTLLGYVLAPVLAWEQPLLVFLLGGIMIMIGAREALGRVSRSHRGLFSSALGALALGGITTTILATTVIVRVQPWWSPQYLVPLLGMILGNALTGVGLGLERSLDQLDTGRVEVELLLARGATWWEASRPVVADAIRTGLIPILNSMSVVGLVSIPGMMTGQILGGVDPVLAARYQIVILFLIAGAIAVSTATAVLISTSSLFDAAHRLRIHRLQRKRR
ncbi:MAG TPA: iron export ABC transporter permease subunit FetB [Deltaproteobacteria bacterium]|nr:iron export ABC transporter permease subunit FetB [Deltaproteobacteria bacterium]